MINTKSKICQIIIDNIFPTKHTFETLNMEFKDHKIYTNTSIELVSWI